MPTQERPPKWSEVWLRARATGRNPVDALVAAGLVTAEEVAPDPSIATRPPPAEPPGGYGLSRLMEPLEIPDDLRAEIERREAERRAREDPGVIPMPAKAGPAKRRRTSKPRRRSPSSPRRAG